MCHFIEHKARLSNASSSLDASHPAYEVIRRDRQCLKSNCECIMSTLIVKF